MTDTPETLDRIAGYLVERDNARARRSAALWYALTERERALVREAAVMGYVQGQRAVGPPENPFPGDMEIVATVLDGAETFPDMYPALSRYVPEGDVPAGG